MREEKVAMSYVVACIKSVHIFLSPSIFMCLSE